MDETLDTSWTVDRRAYYDDPVVWIVVCENVDEATAREAYKNVEDACSQNVYGATEIRLIHDGEIYGVVRWNLGD
jgi:hypothetical protein